jgi:hypothetical protein
MSITIVIIGAIAILLMLFLAGWMLGQMGNGKGYHDGQLMQRAADMARLAKLRRMLEIETDGVTSDQAYLLYDVCEALRLQEGEAQHVLGSAFWMVIDAPVMENWVEGVDE